MSSETSIRRFGLRLARQHPGRKNTAGFPFFANSAIANPFAPHLSIFRASTRRHTFDRIRSMVCRLRCRTTMLGLRHLGTVKISTVSELPTFASRTEKSGIVPVTCFRQTTFFRQKRLIAPLGSLVIGALRLFSKEHAKRRASNRIFFCHAGKFFPTSKSGFLVIPIPKNSDLSLFALFLGATGGAACPLAIISIRPQQLAHLAFGTQPSSAPASGRSRSCPRRAARPRASAAGAGQSMNSGPRRSATCGRPKGWSAARRSRPGRQEQKIVRHAGGSACTRPAPSAAAGFRSECRGSSSTPLWAARRERTRRRTRGRRGGGVRGLRDSAELAAPLDGVRTVTVMDREGDAASPSTAARSEKRPSTSGVAPTPSSPGGIRFLKPKNRERA